MGLEWLRPPRAMLAPDPGTPFRFTLAYRVRARPVGRRRRVVASLHRRRHAERRERVRRRRVVARGQLPRGRRGAARPRDAGLGGTPVQRRYELEAVVRPLGTDAARARGSAGASARSAATSTAGRACRGARHAASTVLAQVEIARAARARRRRRPARSTSTAATLRATFGVDVSFGRIGATALAPACATTAAASHALGGTLDRARVDGRAAVDACGRAITSSASSSTGDDRRARADRAGRCGCARSRAIAARSGVVVMFDGATGGWATLQELRDELVATCARRARRCSRTWCSGVDARLLHRDARPNKIYVDPAGGLRLVGIAWHDAVLPRRVRSRRRRAAVREDRRVQERARAAHRDRAERARGEDARRARPTRCGSAGSRRSRTAGTLPPDEVKRAVDRGPYTAGELAQNEQARRRGRHARQDRRADQQASSAAAYPIDSAADRARRIAGAVPAIAIVYVDGDIDRRQVAARSR